MIMTSANGRRPASRFNRCGNAYAGRCPVSRDHLLVADQVHGDEAVGRVVVYRGSTATTSRRVSLPGNEIAPPTAQEQHGGGAKRKRERPQTDRRQQEIDKPRNHSAEPPERAELPPRARREQQDAREAAGDVDGIGLDAVRHARDGAPSAWPGPTIASAISTKKTPETASIGMMNREGSDRLELGAEEDELRRQCAADLDRAAGTLPHPFDPVRGAERQSQQRRRPRQVVLSSGGGQAPDRHPEEAGQQHRVREERQEQDVRRKPADRREFEEQDERADDEQIDPVAHGSGLYQKVVEFTVQSRRW